MDHDNLERTASRGDLINARLPKARDELVYYKDWFGW